MIALLPHRDTRTEAPAPDPSAQPLPAHQDGPPTVPVELDPAAHAGVDLAKGPAALRFRPLA